MTRISSIFVFLSVFALLSSGAASHVPAFAQQGPNDNSNKVLTGDGPPPNKLGNVGDLYIDASNIDNLIIYKKTAKDTWTNIGTFQGPAGATGPQGPAGATGPQGPAGTIQSQSCPEGQFVTGFNSLGQVICAAGSPPLAVITVIDLAVPNFGDNNVSVLLGNGAGSFGATTNFSTGSGGPISVAVGDFNGDARQDLAVVKQGSHNVSVLLGNGAGSFGATTNFSTGTSPAGIAVGDFNGDARQDLAVVNNNAGGPGTVSILLGSGAGSFGAATNFATGTNSHSVAVGDFNGDARQDLAVTNYNSHNVSVLLGNGAGSFGATTNFSTGSGSISVAVGDFNGDTRQDLAVANESSHNVSVLLGNGAGSFGATTNFSTGTSPVGVAVGDFNGDARQDLAVVNTGSNNVSVLLGNGAGSFGAATNFAVGSFPRFVAVGDFNGDARQDLAVVNNNAGGPGTVSILLGSGAGSFGAATNFATGTNSHSVAVGQFD